MIKVDGEGQEYCLPCADNKEVEGVIVEREGKCVMCKSPVVSKDPMLMDNEEFAEFIKDMTPEYADAWTVMRFESLVNQLINKFMNPEKKHRKHLL